MASSTDALTGTPASADTRWAPMVGFKGRYEVSDDGRVRSVTRTFMHCSPSGATWPHVFPSRELRQQIDNGGYLRVSIRSDDGVSHFKLVHRLVLEAFVGACPAGLECCHNDDNKHNNRLNNLRWDTKSSNMKDAFRHGRLLCGQKGESCRTHKLTEDDVRNIRTELAGGIASSVLASRYGVTYSNIWSIGKRLIWQHV